MIFGFFEPDVPTISVEEVYTSLKAKENITVLDVRTPEEYGKNHISSSINLSVDQVQQHIDDVIPDKNAKIVVYCLSGSRSVIAVDTMVKLGYTNVFNMKSGLLAWRIKKYPLE